MLLGEPGIDIAALVLVLSATLALSLSAVAIEADSLDQTTIGEKSERTSQHYS